MASLNFFNRTQALAPVKKTSTAQPPRIWAANATIPPNEDVVVAGVITFQQ